MRRIWERLRHFRTDDDIRAELESHLEQQAEDKLGRGASPLEARRQARLGLGNPQAILDRTRDQEVATALESVWRDVLLGLRALKKSPVFCLTTILTLALGIGANTAIFTLLHGLVLRSLAVKDPSALALINVRLPSSGERGFGVPWHMLQQLRREQRSFTGIAAWNFSSVTMQDDDGIVRMHEANMVSGNGFELLGVRPYRGRLLNPSDDVRGGPAGGWPVVLSYGFWNDRFRGDPDIVGRRITLSNIPVTVAGIAPPEFQGILPGTRPKVYLPLQFINALIGRDVINAPGSLFRVGALARLKRGVSLRQANAELAVAQKALFDRFIPRELQDQTQGAFLIAVSGRRGVAALADRYFVPLAMMQGLVAIVLVLCCVNVGGLMMSKLYSRQHEFAVRSAIGAARWRLIRQYLTESLVIAVGGAALGGVGAWFGTAALLRFFVDPNQQEGISVRPDNTVLLVSGALAVFATLLFGLVPAWRAGRSDPGTLLKTRGATSARRQIAGRAFVPIQVALSLVLVTVAALLSQSLIRIHAEHAGFDVDHVTLTTPQFQRLPQKGLAILDVYQRMVDRLEQTPGIEAASVTLYTPMTNDSAKSGFRAVTGRPEAPEDPRMAYNDVGPGYFRTMQTRLLAGREFRREERDHSVCMLNQSAASYLFPRQQPLGQYVRTTNEKDFPTPETCRVIGLVEDAKYASIREPAPRTIYFPLSLRTLNWGNLVFLMRSRTEGQAIAAYRQALAAIAPSTALLRFATLRQQRDDSLGTQRLLTLLSNFFGGLALLLSAIGLYGLLASSVAQRTGEIGVRLALGARQGTVLRMILSEASRLLIVGLAIGLAGLYFVLGFVRGMLFGVTEFDTATLLGTTLLLAAVGLAAAFLPARRAASVDPLQALRAE